MKSIQEMLHSKLDDLTPEEIKELDAFEQMQFESVINQMVEDGELDHFDSSEWGNLEKLEKMLEKEEII